jgi:hypothetical protein
MPAPAQAGSNNRAMRNLIHFGTGGFYPQISLIAQILENKSAFIFGICGINLKLKTENLKLWP